MDFDYNSSRERLVLPEYGRNIQKMVNHIKTVDEKEERNKLAHAVVSVMGNLNPHLRDINDFKHKLWDHLAIISNFELDIDYPYDVPQPETFAQKPKQVPYGTNRIRFRHYGRTVELMIKTVMDMPESDERSELLNITANQMKKSYLLWNRESVTDEVILNDLQKISNDQIGTSGITLSESRDLVSQSTSNSSSSSNNNIKGRRKRSNRRK